MFILSNGNRSQDISDSNYNAGEIFTRKMALRAASSCLHFHFLFFSFEVGLSHPCCHQRGLSSGISGKQNTEKQSRRWPPRGTVLPHPALAGCRGPAASRTLSCSPSRQRGRPASFPPTFLVTYRCPQLQRCCKRLS